MEWQVDLAAIVAIACDELQAMKLRANPNSAPVQMAASSR